MATDHRAGRLGKELLVKNINLLVVSFLIGFALTLGLASFASAQDGAEAPADAHGVCLATIERLSAGGITQDELMEIENVCIYQETVALDFLEVTMDRLNGPQPRPNFGTWADAIAQLNSCRHIDEVICPNAGTEPPEPTRTPRSESRSHLLVECRGACAEGPGITNGVRGRGWRAEAVCREGTVPLTYSYRHAVVEGEERERRDERDRSLVLDITYCYDPASASAPRVIERDYATVDLTEVWEHIHRLENACGPDGMRGHSDDWDELCSRFEAVLVHTTRINELSAELGTLRDDLDALRAREDARWAADCGKTDAEWSAMSESEQLELIRSGECDGASSTTVLQSDWHLRFHLGAGLHLIGTSVPATLIAPYGVVYAELEALPAEHFGFFLRGMIGAGDLLDRRGQWNSEGTIGASGIFGGSAGATFRLDEMIAFDLGVASSAVFNPGGQIGTSLHTWPVFNLGGEFRVRVNPVRWLHIEATVGLDYTHSEVRRTNADAFTGVDGLGGHGSVGVGFSF